MVVKPNKARLRLDYTPASPSLRGIRLPVPDLPDPSALKGPVQKLMTLADICTDELMLTVVTLVEKALQQMIPLQFCCCLQKSLTKAQIKY